MEQETASWQRVVDKARDYYDSDDADNFYSRVWGGEDIHIGLYRDAREPIAAASRRTVQVMAERAGGMRGATRVLDIGSGYGGSARYLASRFGCDVTCLNLSVKQNERNRELTRGQDLADRVEVLDGSFEEIPAADGSYELVWSQDSLLHSGRRERALAEVARVLRPGGRLVFTDPMQADDCPAGVLDAVLARIHLASLGSPGFYRAAGERVGLHDFAFDDQSPQLAEHYRRVRAELASRRAELKRYVSADYIERMIAGLGAWIDAGAKGHLVWGIITLRKPAN